MRTNTIGLTTQEIQQVNMFGMTEQDIREQYMNSITAKFSGLEMVVASILSDAQELGAMGQTEAVRKQLNIAKFVLFEMMDAKREEEMVLVSSDGRVIDEVV